MVARDIPGPPLPLSLLADLHGDNLPGGVQRRVRAVVRHDPEAQHTLHAFDRVQRELRSLGEGDDDPPIPADVADRLHTALATADSGVVPFVRPAPRHRALGAAAAVIAALALATGILVLRPYPGPTSQAGPTAQAPHGTTPVDLPPALMLAAVGRIEVRGPLADPVAMRRCLAAAGIDRPLLGSMSTNLGGRDAVLLVAPGAQPGRITALAVGAGCAPGDPQILARREIG